MSEDDALNNEIAVLLGYTLRHGVCHYDGCEWPWTVWDRDGKTNNPVKYDADPAAALGLLEYTLRQKLYDKFPLSVYVVRHGLETPDWIVVIEAVWPNAAVPEVWTGTGDSWDGEGETLTLAMARVCRAVLVAVREGKTT